MASTFKLAVDKMGATDPYNYIGRKGDLFYDPEFGELRISDGDTPYGNGLQAGIGASTPSINQVLTVDSIASLSITLAAGLKTDFIESINNTDTLVFDSPSEIRGNLTVTGVTNFTNINGLNIPVNNGSTLARLSDIAGSGQVLENLIDDLTPQLGGDLDLQGNVLASNTNAPNGVRIDQTGFGNPSLVVRNNLDAEVINVTDEIISFTSSSFSVNSIEYPVTDGVATQAVTTDGAGTLGWSYFAPPQLYTRFYFYNGGSSPLGAVTGSDILGRNFGTWTEATSANVGGAGGISRYSPTSPDYDPTMSGITFDAASGEFRGFEQGSTYQITLEADTNHSGANLSMLSHEIISSTTDKIKGHVAYLGQAATNYDQPTPLNMTGIFTFTEPTGSAIKVQLPSEQSIGYHITEALITIIRIR